jgi:short-subunit dehydrogenase
VNAVVLGATAGVGRALAEELAVAGNALLLAGGDARDLAAEASHLRAVHGARVECVAFHACGDPDWMASIAEAAARLGPVDALLLPIGGSDERDTGVLETAAARQLLETNLLSVIALVTHFLPSFLARGSGCIVGFGSIAAARGRSTNVVYSAAKRALVSYFESLRHKTAGTAVRVQLYQLGYVDTQQTFGRALAIRPCSPARVARAVVKNLHRDVGTVYYPRYWALIACGVRTLPWFIFRRLKL